MVATMTAAPSYFEHNARQPEVDVIPWTDPEEITVVERQLTPEEFERIRQLFEVSL
jgi:hypothetical protein